MAKYKNNEKMKKTKLFSKKSLDIRNGIDDEDDVDPTFGSNQKKPDSKSKTPVLDNYSRDLTKMAEDGKLDPIVGREKEIERVSQILSRRKKNNPILIGEPGCVDGDTLITVRKVSDDTTHENIEIDF